MNIKLDYADLQLGETRQGDCPICHKRKFYVTRKPGGLAYICHRASCSLTPNFIEDESQRSGKQTIQAKPRPTWREAMHLPTEEDRAYFDMRFGINLFEDRGYWVKVTGDCYAFPLYGPYDEDRGLVIRQPTWKGYPPCHREGDPSAPKSRTFLERDAIRAGWYHGDDDSNVVIVEDQVSAMRIAQMGYTSYALLGTWFNDDNYRDLITWKPGRQYTLALDPDAKDKAYKISRKYSQAFKYWQVVNLDKDPKDYHLDEELERALNL